MPLVQLADRIGATLAGGDGSVVITGCAPIDDARPDQLTFLANAKYARFLPTTQAAAVIMAPDKPCPPKVIHVIADDPYFAFRNAMVALHGSRRHPQPVGEAVNGVSNLASVHPQATIGRGSIIHPHAVVEAGASIGRDCVLYPGAYVGANGRVGDECILYPNVVVYDRCVLGNRVILHANTVIGNDGFGYATHDGAHHKIPQTGIVVIEDDVELGSGCVVERAAMGETRIGKGTKFADLISIGHGTHIGAHCLIVSLVGVAGSVKVGNQVVLGGQVGVTGHLKIGDGVQVAARAGVVQDVPSGRKVGGAPAVDLDLAKRNLLVGMDLYGLAQRVKQLERELGRLKQDDPPVVQFPAKTRS
ncbi:MAG: UDP-3-O-(3-hydroxymyristoyl)glucosamine N-acyltransferase [Planctomycetes bacterium]|nr:UDP-3-O-(3-hydroxymyristoyl)glucosamine N-acyltransferase [Planctomycetota bacterium]